MLLPHHLDPVLSFSILWNYFLRIIKCILVANSRSYFFHSHFPWYLGTLIISSIISFGFRTTLSSVFSLSSLVISCLTELCSNAFFFDIQIFLQSNCNLIFLLGCFNFYFLYSKSKVLKICYTLWSPEDL